jgi:hypothetical protein
MLINKLVLKSDTTTMVKVEEITIQEDKKIYHVAKSALPAAVPWPAAAAFVKLLLDKAVFYHSFT